MAYTVLNLIMTLDGFVAGSHDEIDWIGVGASPVPEGSLESKTWDFSEFTSKVGAIVVGMHSYELHLTIAPIIIGRGIRLFDNLDQRYTRLEKVSGEVHSNGMIEVKYKLVK